MNLKTTIGLTTILLCCPMNSTIINQVNYTTPTKITIDNVYTQTNIKLKEVSSLEKVIKKKNNTHHISEENIVDKLSNIANNKEFAVIYFPEKELLINISLESKIDTVKIDTSILRKLSYLGKFKLIHNHSNKDLEEYSSIPLYYLGASPSDLNGYLTFGKIYPQMEYDIISEYGMLNITTDSQTFEYYKNPLFKDMIFDEAEHMQLSLTGITTDSLTSWAKQYRGNVKLLFKSINKKH